MSLPGSGPWCMIRVRGPERCVPCTGEDSRVNPTPKTIQIFLPGGDPRGIRIAEITTRIVQVIEVPRSLLQEFIKMPESNQVALYVLIGDEGDGTAPDVYVGQRATCACAS